MHSLRGLIAPLIACATLGLAPFWPEPHVVGKLRWLAGGAIGMRASDWLDLLLHGAPWLWLGMALAWRVCKKGPPESRLQGIAAILALILAVCCLGWVRLSR